MQYDIAALQHMYGANLDHNANNTTYRWTPGSGTTFVKDGAKQEIAAVTPDDNIIFLTVWDGGGTDTYDLSAYTTSVAIDLRPGAWTTASRAQLADLDGGSRAGTTHWADGNIANALLNADANTDPYAGLIENGKGGSGADVFYANLAANAFTGNGAADTFVWASRDDLLNLAAPDDVIMDFRTGQDDIKLQGVAGGVKYLTYADGEVRFDLGYDGFDGQADAAIDLAGNNVRFNPQTDLIIV
jgi:serralysin